MKKSFLPILTTLFWVILCLPRTSAQGITDPYPGCQAYFYYYFNDSVRTFVKGYPYNFVDQSTGDIVAWFWDFGDGSTSDERNPMHSYSTAGDTVNVCLTTLTADGCKSIYCESFIVNMPALPVECDIRFTIAVSKSIPPVYQFIPDKPDSLASYFWDFGDGSYSSEISPAHRYDYSGNYVICVSVFFQNNCWAYFCDTLLATGYNNECKAGWKAYSDLIMQSDGQVRDDTTFSPLGRYYYFQDLSKGAIIQWKWDFGDGMVSEEQNPSHVYDQNGIYQVCLDILTQDGCSSSFCDTLLVGIVPYCSITGTVKDYSDLDGCGLVIALDNGEILEPAEIVPDFTLKNGQRVRLAFTELTDRASICMVGRIVRIDCIEEIIQPGLCDNFIKLDTEIVLNNGSCNGTASASLVNAEGHEIMASEYLWSTGETTPVIFNLCPGIFYNVIVTDLSGCALSASFSFGGNIVFPDSVIGNWNYEQENMDFIFNLPVFSDSVYCLWDFGDGTRADGSTVSHTYGFADEYVVTLNVYQANGKLLYNQQIPVSPGNTTNTEEQTDTKTELYPVPATDILFLKTSAPLGAVDKIEIFTPVGKLIKSIAEVERTSPVLIQLNVSELPAGFYIGKITGADGNVISFRFVK